MIGFIRRYIEAKEREADAAKEVAAAHTRYYDHRIALDEKRQADDAGITRIVEDRLDVLTHQVRRVREGVLTLMVDRGVPTPDADLIESMRTLLETIREHGVTDGLRAEIDALCPPPPTQLPSEGGSKP